MFMNICSVIAMKRLSAVLALGVAGVAVLVLGFGEAPENTTFHVTLTSPAQYVSGVYTDSFEADAGMYKFGFVPNGDSPHMLSISVEGTSVMFHQEYVLEGTLHDTGISQYYTWRYVGNDTIIVPERQQLQIIIDPHQNTQGPVSVSLMAQ